MTMQFVPIGGGSTPCPWAPPLTGAAEFPHIGNSTTDITVSTTETWGLPGSGADREFAGRIVMLRRLDIDAEIRLVGGPWFIFAGVVDWGASGAVNNDGADGTTGTGAGSSQDETWARGGRAVSTVAAEGGAGGGIQIWCVENEIGTPNRPISSNGGDGNRSGTGNAATSTGRGGIGAMSIRNIDPTVNRPGANQQENWSGGSSDGSGSSGPALAAQFLSAPVGGNAPAGGGSGTGTTGAATGGSGIGGGASLSAAGVGSAGLVATREMTPAGLLALALQGCFGGGGGAAHVNTTGANNSAGGGGGGGVLRYVRNQQAAPTLEANGGDGVGPSGVFTGAAGVVLHVEVS